jgi:hypothetical protein
MIPVFVGAKVTTAPLDRRTHQCHIVDMVYDSYRFQHSCTGA